MGHKLVVTVYPDGRVEAQTVGVIGEACVADIATVENLVGHSAADSRFTDDFYASRSASQRDAKEEAEQSEVTTE